MSTLVDLAFETLGTILAHPAVGTALNLGAVYLVILWLAAAWWAYRDAGAPRPRWPVAPYLVVGRRDPAHPNAVPARRRSSGACCGPPSTVREDHAARLQLALLADDADRDACPSLRRRGGRGVGPLPRVPSPSARHSLWRLRPPDGTRLDDLRLVRYPIRSLPADAANARDLPSLRQAAGDGTGRRSDRDGASPGGRSGPADRAAGARGAASGVVGGSPCRTPGVP
jgi:hypothetical protein